MLLLEEFYIRVPFIDLFNQDDSLSLKRNGYTFQCNSKLKRSEKHGQTSILTNVKRFVLVSSTYSRFKFVSPENTFSGS